MLLSVALLITTVPALSACADEQPTVEVSSHTANAGDEVKVKLEMKNNPGIVSFRFSVNYDKDNMTLQSARESAFTGMIFGDTNSLPYKFLWLDVSNGDKTINGTVAELTFKIKDSARDAVYPIEVTYEPKDINNFSERSVHFEIVNGEITVGEGGDTVSLPDTTTSSSGGSSSGSLPSLPGLQRPTTPVPDNSSLAIVIVDKTASELVEEFNASSTDSSKDSTKDKSSSDESGGSSAEENGSADGSAANTDDTSADGTDTAPDPSQSGSSDNGSEDGRSNLKTAFAVTGAVVALAAITAAVIVIRRKKK